ncbi:Delta-aminolevulinic acid dehydratase [Saezia sanguinis]|uniref:Delta-aminolevulinic acid dehydratase n=1 Tax=Saezia sanguinis TaxID=1965230 RepID=A0A433SG06_9BURK|nr:porphobilinogen synthase [Saezia sanguinis]RUS67673.1 Delta-aminolevulinic acid dehydratase [Saezia sanguinis]
MNDGLLKRPRRLRSTPAMRRMVRETRLSADSLIWPLFVKEGQGIKTEIPSMPGQFHYSVDRLGEAVQTALDAGVGRVLLFGLPQDKDEQGTGAWVDDGIVQRAIRELRAHFPDVMIVTDVCLCEYTSHGHCGVLHGETVDNDETLPLLVRTAVSHARAGADVVAPSDMMDGRVAAIRQGLDQQGFSTTPIMSYAAKYASAFYGPFREAADSAPACGDRRGYQMDMHNHKEALQEALLDTQEGADILMVKPALAYLDIIKEVAAHTLLPVAAYSVSGEYAMIKAAAAAKLIDEYQVMCESAVSIFRAEADILITYHALELAQAMQKGDIG